MQKSYLHEIKRKWVPSEFGIYNFKNKLLKLYLYNK